MNVPNRLTMLRVLMIPVFLVLYLAGPFNGDLSRRLALAVFLLASFTDFLDGYIARRYNLVTNFGKLMDPLADKILVASALIAMVGRADLAAWAAVVIVAREFVVTGFRTLAAERGVILAASKTAKYKTACQMVMISYILLRPPWPAFIADILVWLTIALTAASAAEYLWKNRGLV
ncbi:MAG: CDP-diacylglycerol--glycerol-3-phosphate 3-phosphatidyltransferase [Firmicutes bacterium]|nr:CDP-diacylglycerol--glycerol-3-phosphate 3-phosphatidyltransferase [Bacillota bacterium]